jgi:hypothetical protein
MEDITSEPTRSAADFRALDDVAAYLAQHGVLIGDESSPRDRRAP